MGDIWDKLSDWLWTNPDNQIPRIKFLVVVTTLVLLIMFILDSYRYRSRSRVVKFVLLVLDTASGQILTYTVGLMQLAGFNEGNELVQVWGVLLSIIMGGVGYISAYNLQDKESRRKNEIKSLLDSLIVANLIATGESNSFTKPLWLLWGLDLLRTLHGIRAFDLANRSYAHGKNTELVAGYMRSVREKRGRGGQDDKYLVHGEAEQKVKLQMSSHEIELDNAHENKLITMDKVMNCQGRLLRSSTSEGRRQERVKRRQYICLSYSWYKLLRMRFEELYEDALDSEREENKKMVTQLLHDEKNTENVFRIIRKELGFLNDYLHTRLPIVFGDGFPFMYVFYPIPLGAAAGWLAAELIYYYSQQEKSHRADVIITAIVTISIVLKEFWEMATYIFSDWNKVFLISTYVEKAWLQGSRVAENLIGFLCNYTLILHWHDTIGQYQLFNSFKYRPRLRNMMFYASLGTIARGEEGAKTQNAAVLTSEAKEAIVNSLRRILSLPHDADHCLTGGVAALEANEVGHLSWACNLQTHVHTLLVWHVATALCEIHLSQQLPSIVTKRNKLFASTRVHFSSPTREEQKKMYREDILRSSFMVATSLSQYCAYLLVSIPEILPDYSISTNYIFQMIVDEARKILDGCKNREKMYARLMENHKPRETSSRKSSSILVRGTQLAYELIEEYDHKRGSKDEEDPTGRISSDDDADKKVEAELKRWKILEEFWAEFILCLAPSDNADAHSKHLHKGGEFMTHLWALLYHAGIVHPPLKPIQDA